MGVILDTNCYAKKKKQNLSYIEVVSSGMVEETGAQFYSKQADKFWH